MNCPFLVWNAGGGFVEEDGAAAAALSDSMPLDMGMRMRASALRSTSRGGLRFVADKQRDRARTNRLPTARAAAFRIGGFVNARR